MATYSASPQTLLKSFILNRNLIYMLAKRDIKVRYRGSLMGLFWSFLLPVIMLTVYSFVYGVILKVKWMGSESSLEFALIIFLGMLLYNFFSDCISRATTIILSNTNYVKKVAFPLEIFTYIIFATALFQLLVSLAVWIVFYSILHGLPHVTVIYFPILLIPMMFLIFGISWFLAALGVYIRDVTHIIPVLLTTLMLLTPVFFPVSAIPEVYRHFFYLNPLTYILEQMRAVLIFGQSPEWSSIMLLTAKYSILAWLGFAWFQKTRKGFADVL